MSMSPVLEDRLSQTAERTFGPGLEEAIVTYLLDYPDRTQAALDMLDPDLFVDDRCQYVVAWIKNLTETHGGPPSRALLLDKVMRHLTVDDRYQPVVDLINRKPAVRTEGVMVATELRDFIKHQRYAKIWATESYAAFLAKDYDAIDAMFHKAQALTIGEEAGPFQNGYSGDDILNMEIPPTTWLVEDILSDAGFFVIGGPLKSMKTSALLDLAVSLASGKPFLGKFKVTEPTKIALVTVETGKNEMAAKIKKIATAKGVTSLANLRWEPHAPRLASKEYLNLVRAYLRKEKPKVMIIDPLYVSLEGAEHQNIMSMGPILNEYSMACMENGCIPGAVHHFNRKSEQHAIPTLQDLSQAGCGEFARQWLLMRRREAYKHDGRHQLWMVTGGSDGHSANNRLMIDEQAHKGWTVSVEPHQEAEGRDRGLQDSNLLDKLLVAMDQMTDADPKMDLSTKRLMAYMDVTKAVAQKAIKVGMTKGMIQEYQATISNNLTKCYKRIK